jgi:Fe/S biogenesis protein NfuA
MGPREPAMTSSHGVQGLLQMTDGALRELVALLHGQQSPERLGLWTEITGVSGDDFTYDLSLRPLEQAAQEDVIEHHGDLPVVIPRSSVADLQGATVDLVGDLASGGLIVDNPNRPSPAVSDFPALELTGDVSSRIRQVLHQQVNPSIAIHGGRAEFVSVEDRTAFVRLSGGCQGCGLASKTLAQGIEVAITRSVPEITQVVDVTDHDSGVNPYYDPSEM